MPEHFATARVNAEHAHPVWVLKPQTKFPRLISYPDYEKQTLANTDWYSHVHCKIIKRLLWLIGTALAVL